MISDEPQNTYITDLQYESLVSVESWRQYTFLMMHAVYAVSVPASSNLCRFNIF